MAAPPDDDPAFRDLAREFYWAQESAARARMDTPELRDRLQDFSVQMRADETVIIPHGEGNLASPPRWRRKLKYRLWRLMRPATWRYDRLIADHAELTTGLAEHLMALEAEVDRLKAQMAEAPRADPTARETNRPEPTGSEPNGPEPTGSEPTRDVP